MTMLSSLRPRPSNQDIAPAQIGSDLSACEEQMFGEGAVDGLHQLQRCLAEPDWRVVE
ncbi:MAG: hypothetical protein ABJD57_10590 [Roseibium sp.]|uniref:hypothetical protein n=1 Tax=Roseibium sp. TaxID=1936156 RepID=UPI003264806B